MKKGIILVLFTFFGAMSLQAQTPDTLISRTVETVMDTIADQAIQIEVKIFSSGKKITIEHPVTTIRAKKLLIREDITKKQSDLQYALREVEIYGGEKAKWVQEVKDIRDEITLLRSQLVELGEQQTEEENPE